MDGSAGMTILFVLNAPQIFFILQNYAKNHIISMIQTKYVLNFFLPVLTDGKIIASIHNCHLLSWKKF